MLKNTFIHLPAIGEKTEKRIWQDGVSTWQDALLCNGFSFLNRRQKEKFRQELEESVEALSRGDASFFYERLRGGDTWRAYPEFAHKILYLDIETTGGAFDDTAVTMIGIYDGHDYMPYIAGKNLYDFPDRLKEAELLVTFFGSGFDIPALKVQFPRADFNKLHIDLCFTLKKLGLHGGLKRIEQKLNIQRDPDVDGMNGYDAVKLWYAYLRGNENALELLVKYNKEDVCNMKFLMDYAYRELRERCLNARAHFAESRRY